MAALPRILIFGGSFDPPTLAHEAIMRACLELPQFDEVWVMPSCSRADKAISTLDEHRLGMLKAVWRTAFEANPRLTVSDLEFRLGPPTRQLRTMRVLSARYPDARFWFAVGGDAYRDMAQWYGARSFMDAIRLVVFTEKDMPSADSNRLIRLHLPAALHDMSSGRVRNALARGADASAWISEPVQQYITEHGLYYR